MNLQYHGDQEQLFPKVDFFKQGSFSIKSTVFLKVEENNRENKNGRKKSITLPLLFCIIFAPTS